MELNSFCSDEAAANKGRGQAEERKPVASVQVPFLRSARSCLFLEPAGVDGVLPVWPASEDPAKPTQIIPS